MGVFRWTGKRERAAGLVAEDRLSNEDIAAEMGISRSCLDAWKRRSEFAQRVADLVAAERAAVEAKGIVERRNRLGALNDRWRRMRSVLDARAVEHAGVPAGDSGLLVRQVKLVRILGAGEGERVREVAEYAVDGVLLKAMLDAEKQAAIEMGQWQSDEVRESTTLVREYVGVGLADV